MYFYFIKKNKHIFPECVQIYLTRVTIQYGMSTRLEIVKYTNMQRPLQYTRHIVHISWCKAHSVYVAHILHLVEVGDDALIAMS